MLPFDDFETSPIPNDFDAYQQYRQHSYDFIAARNHRIDRLHGTTPARSEK